MATVTTQVVGGKIQLKENVTTVAELKQILGLESHQASVNGEPEDDSYALQDGEYVTFAPKVKGA